MDRVAVFGVSWRQGGPEALARLTVPAEERRARLGALAEEVGAEELWYLATCNRVEVALVAAPGVPLEAYRPRVLAALTRAEPAPGEAARTLRAWAGEGAAEHLMLVACGLDSARVGETDVAAQVREATELAREEGRLGPRLTMILDEALRVARRVHADTELGRGRESLAEIALDRARARLAETPGAALLVGVSPMTERCGCELTTEGVELVVANRSRANATRLADELGAAALTLDELRAAPPAVEVAICATAAPDPVLGRGDLERLAARAPSGRPPLVVDLAVPPDVDPEDAAALGFERVGMDAVIAAAEASRTHRLTEAADARTLVDEALVGLRRRLAERLLAPRLAAVQRRYRETALEGLARLFERELAGVDEPGRDALRRWAETLARRFAHLPTAGLREVAAHAGNDAVEAFFSRADARLLEALRAAEAARDDAATPREPEEGAA